MWKIFLAILLGITWTNRVLSDEPVVAFKSPKATAAYARYRRASLEITQRAADETSANQKHYYTDLQGLLRIELGSGNLKEANWAKAESDYILNGGAEPTGGPKTSLGRSARSRYLTAASKIQDEHRGATLGNCRRYLADLEPAKRTAMFELRNVTEADRIVAEMSRIQAMALDASEGGVINLLKFVNLTNARVSGLWGMRNGALFCDAGAVSRLQFPYVPPVEYDYNLKFVITKGTQCLDAVCVSEGRQFSWSFGAYGNTVAGFRLVDGKDVDDNVTTRKAKQCYKLGQQYSLTLRIRKGSVEAYLDNNLVDSVKTDINNMTLIPAAALPRPDTIGVMVFQNAAEIVEAKAVEVNGEGQLLRDGDER